MNRVRIPETYAEWMDVLDLLEEGAADAAVLEAMQGGTLAWQTGVAERFGRRLTAVINTRINRAKDRFQREITRSGQERSYVGAMMGLRREFRFLKTAVHLPAIPEEHRSKLEQLVQAEADSVQQSLADSARTDRSGRLAVIVRNNPVNT